jgi:NCS1 family nucleobase:cation symporter-1
LLGAIAGVMIADYWLWRRQQLKLADLYRTSGCYGRWNWPAFVAMAVAILPLIPGFLTAAMTPGGIVKVPDLLDRLYTYGWLWTFVVAALSYWILQLGRRRQSLRREYA